ncbi:sterol desaturase family protein [Alphaproteobacteria bacterium]|nr:sterol desaturase family protein [Alphaproteobacteria bacterium]MDB2668977.1 sterol desaturase family protein [Alphaproteobacteria bacterium]MDB4106496.1 sterol desaturase family protein [bacterium]MDC0147394.1 sterol desaturase family protein [Alphaproteobacteria bacterium]
MRSIWKSYFSHPTVLLLFVGFAASLYGVTTLQLWDQWGWIFLIIAIAPFYEWVTHKYVLHQELTPKPGWKRDFQIRLHHGHHLHPDDRHLQFAPTSALVVMFAQLYGFYALVTWSWETPLMPLLASLAYYLVYEWIHLAHHTKTYTAVTKSGLALREAHMRHHFHNENYNWGITNGLGDIVLNTWKSTQEVPKSATVKKLAGYDGQASHE